MPRPAGMTMYIHNYQLMSCYRLCSESAEEDLEEAGGRVRPKKTCILLRCVINSSYFSGGCETQNMSYFLQYQNCIRMHPDGTQRDSRNRTRVGQAMSWCKSSEIKIVPCFAIEHVTKICVARGANIFISIVSLVRFPTAAEFIMLLDFWPGKLSHMLSNLSWADSFRTRDFCSSTDK